MPEGGHLLPSVLKSREKRRPRLSCELVHGFLVQLRATLFHLCADHGGGSRLNRADDRIDFGRDARAIGFVTGPAVEAVKVGAREDEVAVRPLAGKSQNGSGWRRLSPIRYAAHARHDERNAEMAKPTVPFHRGHMDP